MKQGTPNNEITQNSNEEKESEPKASLSNSELAAKNALRFASKDQSQATSRLLPTDLQDRASQEAQSSSSDVYEGGSSAQEEEDDIDQLRTLSGARDLIGVCRSMCPDEELLRREREGDIQLLEVRFDIAMIHIFVIGIVELTNFLLDYWSWRAASTKLDTSRYCRQEI